MDNNYFRKFTSSVSEIKPPKIFNFPFVVDVHPLCALAMQELQDYLINTASFTHDFGLDSPNEKSIGKMFGVLIVEDSQGNLGYLCAYSGKLANSNHIDFFVPPVFDMLQEKSFYLKVEYVLNQINYAVDSVENSLVFKGLKQNKLVVENGFQKQISEQKIINKSNKKERKQIRIKQQQLLSDQDYTKIEDDLIKQSLRDKYILRSLIEKSKQESQRLANQLKVYTVYINALKSIRKKKSNELQNSLFKSYSFLNAKGENRNLLDIFNQHTFSIPPAGAGECCAPKLLHFAYKNQLKPLAISEFWWGLSPKSEIKKHKQVYPACWGKCQPILNHMLQGLSIKPNPFLINHADGKELPIVFEDPYLIVVNKPTEFLSVPGLHVTDSVYERIKTKYPNISGPIIIHRLDMSTSGLMVLAKSKEIHKQIQAQFIKRTVKKQYQAVLEGQINQSKGIINLPLCLDINDRPKQMVDFNRGKIAETLFEVLEVKDNKTRVLFTPITGRTHQLRMHAAHHLGLNAPIVGDDLYGTQANRLHLHAYRLSFKHPFTQKEVNFVLEPDF